MERTEDRPFLLQLLRSRNMWRAWFPL